MNDRIILCSFSGAAAELPKGRRSDTDVLRALAPSPRVSTWDMSEHRWLCGCIDSLKRGGLITEDKAEPYPWHRYNLTEAGAAAMAERPAQGAE